MLRWDDDERGVRGGRRCLLGRCCRGRGPWIETSRVDATNLESLVAHFVFRSFLICDRGMRHLHTLRTQSSYSRTHVTDPDEKRILSVTTHRHSWLHSDWSISVKVSRARRSLSIWTLDAYPSRHCPRAYLGTLQSSCSSLGELVRGRLDQNIQEVIDGSLEKVRDLSVLLLPTDLESSSCSGCDLLLEDLQCDRSKASQCGI